MPKQNGERKHANRCIIAADGIFEWRKNAAGSKTPLWIHRTDGAPFAFAGLWDVWRSSDQRVASYTMVTAPANDFMEQTHSRMPIVLDETRALEWLQLDALEVRDALNILIPSADARESKMYAVSARVENLRNDDASLVAMVCLGSPRRMSQRVD